MGSEINFGSRKFNAIGKGRLPQPQSVEAQTRVATSNTFSTALTALNATALASNNLIDVIPGVKLIQVKSIFAYCLFVDSATANYLVSDYFQISPTSSYLVNKDNTNIPTIPGNLSIDNIGFLMQVDNNNQISIDGFITGGSVLRATGITPGAADSISGAITVVYVPL